MSDEILKTPQLNDTCDDDCTYKGLEKVAEAVDDLSGAIVPLKLYHSLGNNNDGAISQDVVTAELEDRMDKAYFEGGEKGESPIRTDVPYAFDYAVLVPDKGLTGQVLAKRSNLDYDTEWVDAGGGGGTQHGIPAGGTTGQHLVKQSSLDYDAIWQDDVVPSGGTTGQVLKKASNYSYDVEWGNAGGSIILHNQTVSNWVSNSDISGFPYRGTVTVDGIDETYGVIVTFGEEDATSGKYAKLIGIDTNKVYVYAKEIPTSLILPAIYILIGGGIEPMTAIITYVSEHGTKPADKVVDVGYELTSGDLPTLSEAGYTFNGWNKNVGDEIIQDTVITASWSVAPPTPITDLTGTRWRFNYHPLAGIDGDFHLNFSSAGFPCTIIRFAPYGTHINMSYFTLESSWEAAYYNSNWKTYLYRDIHITGGDDATNADLINWLLANATQLS